MEGQRTASCQTDGTYKAPTCRQCAAVRHCKDGFVRCSSESDQRCATANDCDDGYTQDMQCTGALCLPSLMLWAQSRVAERACDAQVYSAIFPR
jgi:hypothetical protein